MYLPITCLYLPVQQQQPPHSVVVKDKIRATPDMIIHDPKVNTEVDRLNIGPHGVPKFYASRVRMIDNTMGFDESNERSRRLVNGADSK